MSKEVSNQIEELKSFVKTNAYWIYRYINDDVLKDIGVMNSSYFINIVEEIFEENENQLSAFEELNTDCLPYVMLTLINGTGNMTYTGLRPETINFAKINKEASTYYNYLRFCFKDDTINSGVLDLQLMQSKIGGMPIDADFVKYNKEITIKTSGLSQYIQDNIENEKSEDSIASKGSYVKITEAINKILNG